MQSSSIKNMIWNYPTNIWFGLDRILDSPKACTQLNIVKPLIVTDSQLSQTSIIKKLFDILQSHSISFDIFDKIQPNPISKNVFDGIKVYKKNNNDGIIAIGGGSALDIGKTIAFMSHQTKPLWDFEDINDQWKKANSKFIDPIIAIPTTAGTGSETGRASLIINEKLKVKKIIFHPKMMPSIVILDPLLTLSLPPSLTAYTGMDALAHNIEAYCSNGFHPLADGIAVEGIRIIYNNLLTAYLKPNDLHARSNMLIAASMGSTSFQKGLGAIHSLSHPINALYNIHHGLTNGVIMPYVLQHNKIKINSRITRLTSYLNIPHPSFDSFMGWILKLRKELHIPNTLNDLGIKYQDLKILTPMALEDPSTFGNPIKLNLSNIKKLYDNCWSGKL